MGNLKAILAEVTAAVWHGIFWLINLNFFQQLPKEMLLFPKRTLAQASMARFYFHDISFLCRKAQRTNYHANPLQAQAHALHRGASENASMSAMGKLHDKTYLPSLKQHLQPRRIARFTVATGTLLTDSVSSYLICLFGFFPGVLSVFAQASLFFSTGGLRSEILRCLTKGKGASPSASKTLVRPKYHPCFIVFEKPIWMCLCYAPLAKKEKDAWCLLLLSTVRSTRKRSQFIYLYDLFFF